MANNKPVRDRVLRCGAVERLCKSCENWWPLARFVTHAKGRRGHLGECRMCFNDKRRANAPRYLRRSLMTPEQLEKERARDRAKYLEHRSRGLSAAEARQKV